MRSCRIITGDKYSGKSTRLLEISKTIPNPEGFISIRTENGYSLLDLRRGKTSLLMTDEPLFPDRFRRWYFDQKLFDAANSRLESISSGTVFIDEIGRLELDGGGFAPALRALRSHDIDLIIAVRDAFLQDVIERFLSGTCVSVEEPL